MTRLALQRARSNVCFNIMRIRASVQCAVWRKPYSCRFCLSTPHNKKSEPVGSHFLVRMTGLALQRARSIVCFTVMRIRASVQRTVWHKPYSCRFCLSTPHNKKSEPDGSHFLVRMTGLALQRARSIVCFTVMRIRASVQCTVWRKPYSCRFCLSAPHNKKSEPDGSHFLVRMTGLALQRARSNVCFTVMRVRASVQCTVWRKPYSCRFCLSTPHNKKSEPDGSHFLVRMTGLEPARPFDHKNLNLTRLPIPPHPQANIL